jgi:hypothetical protein
MAEENTLVEFLATTRLGEKGQMTVPKEYRSKLGLKPWGAHQRAPYR